MAVAVGLEGTAGGDKQGTQRLARSSEVLETREEADEELRVRPAQQRGVEVPHETGKGRLEVRSRLAHAARLLRRVM
ncbi:MAG: hypothetical protein WAV54_06005 [Acidimicrobiales bacterium]